MAKKSLKKLEDEAEALAVAEEVASSVVEELSVKKGKKAEREDGLAESEFDLVEIEIPVGVKIAKQRLGPGKHKVPRHQARDIVAMANKKIRADLNALSVTSRSYLVNKSLNGSINVKEVDQINFKK